MKGFFIAGARNDWLPKPAKTLAIEALGIEQQLLVHIDQTRKVVGPLNIADHPVKRVGDS